MRKIDIFMIFDSANEITEKNIQYMKKTAIAGKLCLKNKL